MQFQMAISPNMIYVKANRRTRVALIFDSLQKQRGQGIARELDKLNQSQLNSEDWQNDHFYDSMLV